MVTTFWVIVSLLEGHAVDLAFVAMFPSCSSFVVVAMGRERSIGFSTLQ